MSSIKDVPDDIQGVENNASILAEVETFKEVRSDLKEIVDQPKAKMEIVKISDLAKMLGLSEVEKTLPNGRVINTIVWSPDHLQDVFEQVSSFCQKNEFGKNDLITIDGPAPGWLVSTIAHACHPVQTAVKYPQGGPDAVLPLSGVHVVSDGTGKDLSFSVTESDDHSIVSFKLTSPQIDVKETLKTLLAPSVKLGVPVFITGRGPVSILSSLTEAYAHIVPYVAAFQPGVGYVVCVSHDANHPIGEIVESA